MAQIGRTRGFSSGPVGAGLVRSMPNLISYMNDLLIDRDGGEYIMGKFLAVHTLPSPSTVEAATPIAKATKANSTLDAYWVSSWIQLNKEGKVTKILCEWDAKDIESIQKVIKEVLKKVAIPVDGIYPMAKADAEAYR